MSYELFFNGSDAPSYDECAAYFQRRRSFEVRKNQFMYMNEDTGVYFAFDCLANGPGEVLADEGESQGWAEALVPGVA